MYPLIKRLFDLLVSLTVLVAFSPLLLLIALAIRMETPGSPLFVQQRVGKNATLFTIVKFRSMVENAVMQGPVYTQKNDTRVTRVGKFLRATSLDELPQLWNVLMGDMSLVGPRPELPIDEARYRPDEWQTRHRVRPGITGLAQVNGRSAINKEDKIRYDLAYAVDPSLSMDADILFRTVGVVLRRKGTN
jgi:lipopolysaccharide/colanic/teichoic acid biosynthesis glycosyltransferase